MKAQRRISLHQHPKNELSNTAKTSLQTHPRLPCIKSSWLIHHEAEQPGSQLKDSSSSSDGGPTQQTGMLELGLDLNHLLPLPVHIWSAILSVRILLILHTSVCLAAWVCDVHERCTCVFEKMTEGAESRGGGERCTRPGGRVRNQHRSCYRSISWNRPDSFSSISVHRENKRMQRDMNNSLLFVGDCVLTLTSEKSKRLNSQSFNNVDQIFS